ncbi:NlpC/P60 family protein [Singulisphaera sp. GP187]|uniref:NlpC/P60 family protein n=1 Tax=Singulisphaera sp. GP187 TaxID=1882752 RepID=UPI0009296F1F|nr:NlpC/P60 family protein [Singulisphaera sp. GP187]SIO32736.1 NlpC/P60 family protein [Singulisphaera sp. GP187]
MSRRVLFVALICVFCGIGLPRAGVAQAVVAEAPERVYHSPYRVEFTVPSTELIGDLERTERGDHRVQAAIPFPQWYSPRTLERWRAWGPRARDYPGPAGLERWTVERKRERVIAVAMRFYGYRYQHHHIPDWNPPAHWPWKSTCAGSNGKGVDCSNLTGFVYNLGFGLRLNTDVEHQAEERAAKGPGEERTTRLRVVELPSSYEERIKMLRTGDLLFIRNRSGKISHVVLWVGPIGRSPDGGPLVLDSHGEDIRDSLGQPIPCGVQLRPFRENSWYNHSASHALRIFQD